MQLSEVYQLIHAYLETTGGFKGHEERGIYFGRVFALLALLRSERLETNVSSGYQYFPYFEILVYMKIFLCFLALFLG